MLDIIEIVFLYLRIALYPLTIWAIWMDLTAMKDWRENKLQIFKVLLMIAFICGLFMATILKVVGYNSIAVRFADFILTPVLLIYFITTISGVIRKDKENYERTKNGNSILLDAKEQNNEYS